MSTTADQNQLFLSQPEPSRPLASHAQSQHSQPEASEAQPTVLGLSTYCLLVEYVLASADAACRYPAGGSIPLMSSLPIKKFSTPEGQAVGKNIHLRIM
jgi:hypothetical protein